jgi:hypothetical protein
MSRADRASAYTESCDDVLRSEASQVSTDIWRSDTIRKHRIGLRLQVVDSQWRDVRVVEGARLESDAGERHQATPKR